MRIKQQAVGQVVAQLQADTAEKDGVAWLTLAALRITGEAGISFAPEQLLAIGMHLLAALRRGATGETLPEVGPETLEQVSADALRLAANVLEPFAAERGYAWNDTEALLLAVHFEAAMES